MPARPDPFARAAAKPITIEDAARLVRFEQWVAKTLFESLHWPEEPAKRDKQVLQCRAFIVQAVADMGKRGYLFQDRELVRMVRETIGDIAQRQARGEISDLFPYLRTTWNNYVGARAEELRAKAIGLGQHIDRLVGGIRTQSIAELADRDRRERNSEKSLRAAKKAARQGQCSDAATALLPGF